MDPFHSHPVNTATSLLGPLYFGTNKSSISHFLIQRTWMLMRCPDWRVPLYVKKKVNPASMGTKRHFHQNKHQHNLSSDYPGPENSVPCTWSFTSPFGFYLIISHSIVCTPLLHDVKPNELSQGLLFNKL